MHIRQLARNAALITVAAIVTAGFSTGIAEATSAAPTSTVSVSSVVHSGTAPRVHTPRMYGCQKYTFCALTIVGNNFDIAQEFGCTSGALHEAVSAKIYEMINLCTTHAVSHSYKAGGHGCVSANSSQAQGGGYPAIAYYFVSSSANCL